MNAEKIQSFLNSLGVEMEENDPLIEYIEAQVREYICNATNLNEVPEGLSWCLVYRAAGQYLRLKKDMGQLNLEGLDLEAPAKQIQEGDTNLNEVPEGLSWCLVYRAAGQYLRLKKDMGQLNLEGLDLEAPAKQIQEGDTNIVFAVDTELSPERRLERLISSLAEAGKDQFSKYRRLVW